MKSYVSRLTLGMASAALMLFSVGCGSSSSSSNPNPNPQPQNGTVNLLISDASTEDWATIGVKVLSISLTPQGGGSDVPIYTAPSPAPYVNLLQLDQLSEIIGNVPVQAGTYTAATITVSGNPGDVILTTSADPETGFAAAASTTIPSSQIQILGTKGGSSGSLTVPVHVTLLSPLVVASGQSNALDLEFDLSHPAFIVAHVPPSANGTTMWAVNFNPCLRHRRIFDRTRLILRHHYGTVTGVSTDNSTLIFDKDYPVYPPTTPETAITSSQTLSVLADSTNGTLYFDLDNSKNNATIKDFGSIAATIIGKYIRVAARYQVDGSLVAVRLYASSSFNSVWISPEGHVLHVNVGNGTTGTLVVENELGQPVPLTINSSTNFYFRVPAKAEADTKPIGQGSAFLSNLARGFKVHASVVDPLAASFTAQSIDIEIARYDGSISNSNATSFEYTHDFHTASDDYQVTLPYINVNTPNGSDPQTGAAITGFKWWNFTFPTIVDSGSNAIQDFYNATNGGVTFTCGTGASATSTQMQAAGESYATWNDPNAPGAWAAPWTVLTPTHVPMGTVAAGFTMGSPNATFTMTIACSGGTQSTAVTVDLNTTSGSTPLIYQVDFTNGIFTVSPVDITTSAGQTTLTTNLLAGTPVAVYGIPQSDGSIKDYVLFYYTGVAPAPASAVI
jgi:hypothetical protein